MLSNNFDKKEIIELKGTDQQHVQCIGTNSDYDAGATFPKRFLFCIVTQ